MEFRWIRVVRRATARPSATPMSRPAAPVRPVAAAVSGAVERLRPTAAVTGCRDPAHVPAADVTGPARRADRLRHRGVRPALK